jgi:hypothetical protein
MSNDALPHQLRGSGDCRTGCGCLLCEAANEIDRLCSEVERKDGTIQSLMVTIAKLEALLFYAVAGERL